MAATHGRRNLRLRRWDYARDGAYFITIATENNADMFGQVVAGEMRLNTVGEIVAENWRWLPSQYPHVTLDEWRVMPNHMHGILVPTTPVAPVETSGSVWPAGLAAKAGGSPCRSLQDPIDEAREYSASDAGRHPVAAGFLGSRHPRRIRVAEDPGIHPG